MVYEPDAIVAMAGGRDHPFRPGEARLARSLPPGTEVERLRPATR